MSNNEISDDELRILMREIDQNQNGIIQTEEFLQVRKKSSSLDLQFFFFCSTVNECN